MNRDLIELLAAFNDHGVEFIVVGAHALAAHGHVRATKDLDLWIRPSLENASRAMHALAYFGAPLHDLTSSRTSACREGCRTWPTWSGSSAARTISRQRQRVRGGE